MMTNREYLEQRVKTASPAQLHLMLIEGAIRFATAADRAYEANDVEAASEPLMRAMDIVSELLAAVKHSKDDINVKLASLYQFVFTRLTMAYVNTDREKLAESLKILQFERDTWRQACEKAVSNDRQADARLKGPHKPAQINIGGLTTSGGLSIEA